MAWADSGMGNTKRELGTTDGVVGSRGQLEYWDGISTFGISFPFPCSRFTFPLPAPASLRCQPRRAIQADGFAVEVGVAQDVGDQVGELLRLAQARRKGD